MSLQSAASTSSRAILPCCRAAGKAVHRRTFASSRKAAAAAASTSSTTTTQKSYRPPLKKGELAIYDEAVAYLEKDREEKLQRLRQLEEAQKSSNSEEQDGVQDEILGLQIASEINMPETRWMFKHGQGDMSKPVFRYLAEQAWRRDGRLGILMQRVTQMNVVPDLLAEIDPDLDLRLLLNEVDIEPGSFLDPSKTITAPQIKVQVYHPEERLYTLLMVDPDSPHPERKTFKTQCHWAITNIPISATTASIGVESGNELLPYVPPHPQKGTPYHRYTFLLFEQQQGQLAETKLPEADSFNVREYVRDNNLKPAGVHFFRQVWDQSVSDIYRDVLKQPEPVFGRPEKMDRLQRDEITDSVVGDRHALL